MFHKTFPAINPLNLPTQFHDDPDFGTGGCVDAEHLLHEMHPKTAVVLETGEPVVGRSLHRFGHEDSIGRVPPFGKAFSQVSLVHFG